MDSYRIASFNMYKFSTFTNKNLEAIASIIRNNRIDILAIQEIFSKEALDSLVGYLKPHWEGRWATPNSRSVSAAEGYGFVWNKQRVELSRNRAGKIFEPRIWMQYSHKEADLIRDPFYGRFVIRANRMTEFRIINTHIMFSLKREENDSDDHESSEKLPGAVTMRKREFSTLATKILPRLDDKVYDAPFGETDDYCRKPITILMGDYNLNLKGSGATDTFIDDSLIVIKDSNSEKRIITVQDELTTLKKADPSDGKIHGYRNNFDHFTYDKNRPIDTKCWAIDEPNQDPYFAGDYDKYKKEVSDHLMIIMEITFK